MESKSIGTVNEKSIHSFLKDYFEPDKSKQEVRVNGYIADILNSDGIIEIQSKSFDKLRDKLGVYLEEYNVKVVYPLIVKRYTSWIDPVTKEFLERRRAPVRASEIDIFKELYKIREYLGYDKLSLCMVLLEIEEYKYLDGYGLNCKNHATKIDKIPTKVVDTITFGINGGYERFIPYTEDGRFRAIDFAGNARSRLTSARLALLILNELGIVRRIDRDSKGYIYGAVNKKTEV